MFEEIVEQGGVKITLKNTIANQLLWRKRLEVFKITGDEFDADVRYMFLEMSSHTLRIEGVRWTIPNGTADAEVIEASYQEFIQLIPMDMLRKCSETVHGMYGPLSDQLEKPESTLTKEELADPN